MEIESLFSRVHCFRNNSRSAAVLNKCKTSAPLNSVTLNGRKYVRPDEIAEAFNEHFVTIGPKLASKIEAPTDADPMAYVRNVVKDKRLPKFLFKHVEVSYVKQEINKLKTSKSPGPDKIPIKILKDAVEIVSGPLTKIFNRSLDTGVFPDLWKLARVAPIFKAGQKSELTNYRPISVVSILSRLLEKMAHDEGQITSQNSVRDFCDLKSHASFL